MLGASLGLAALFLYWDTTSPATTGATINVLFGSIFTICHSTVPVVAALGAAALALIAVLYRPLLAQLGELRPGRGPRDTGRLVGVRYLLALAVAVRLSSVTIGAILSTALLVGPAAAALRITNRTGTAIALAAVLGVAATWLGILLA